MSISHPRNLIAFLTENELHAKKSSSQNFLVDENIVHKILKEAKVSSEDFIVEIGPGPGALTEAFLKMGCRVCAIEKDQKLGNLLRRLCPNEATLQIFIEDFLEFPLENFLEKNLPSGKKAKVIANLPYHITTPILTKLVPLHHLLSDVVVMVQKEVAERCIARAGEEDYNSLSLFLQFFTKMTYGFTVEPTCFLPKPSVKSAVIHFHLEMPPSVSNRDFLFELIRTSFGKRRKMLKTSLKEILPSALIEQVLIQEKINPLCRPEELSLSQFITLSEDLLPLLQQNTNE